jgi:hypothetical protein
LQPQKGRNTRATDRAFLVMLVCWLAFIFGSFGLLARPNVTVSWPLFVCALSFSSAIFLIPRPFEGMIQIPSAPLREALGRLDQ